MLPEAHGAQAVIAAPMGWIIGYTFEANIRNEDDYKSST